MADQQVDSAEFERQYAARSGLTVDSIRRDSRVVPCDCGDDICEGWGMVSLGSDVCGECGHYSWRHPREGCGGFTKQRRWPRADWPRYSGRSAMTSAGCAGCDPFPFDAGPLGPVPGLSENISSSDNRRASGNR